MIWLVLVVTHVAFYWWGHNNGCEEGWHAGFDRAQAAVDKAFKAEE